ncbi:MAG TPA: pantetheine-phosphate adenylyltransferase [Longimicrobiaceae bacterium]
MNERARVALCPGSFDPLTLGHEDIVRRALQLADEVIVAVGHQPSETKRHLFAIEERLELIREVFANEPRVIPAEFQGLTVEFARQRGASLIVRGVRTAGDFEYEARMARMNRALAPGIDTVYLAADPRHVFLSASLVREVWSLGGDVAPFVSPPVLRALERRREGSG